MLIEEINSEDNFRRKIFLICVSKIKEFDVIKLPHLSKYFTLFIANNEEVIIEEYSQKAKKLIKSGLVYLCTWGKECEKIHDIFDEENFIMEINQEIETDNDSVIMTTWHKDESLKEALYFFLMNTSPTEKYYSECKTSLVVIIGNPIEGVNIKTFLENQKLLEDE